MSTEPKKINMNNKLNYGLVGAGRIAQSYADAFAVSETAQLVAVADVRPDAANALAEQTRCRSFASYQAMAEEMKLDAVVVCTPPVTHKDVSLYFLTRGMHVLCEKPLSVDRASALEMIDAAARHEKLLTMASKFRFVADVRQARSIVASGLIGDVVLFENAFTAHVDMRERWNADRSVSGGGVLIDNGTHAVDIMRYFLGRLSHVQAIEGKRTQGLAVDETVRLSVRSAAGVVASSDLSWSIDKELASYIQIFGAHGTISIGWKESKYRLASNREWVKFGTGYDKLAAFGAQVNNFSRAIRGEEQLVVTPDDALASVEVVEAAYAALTRGNWLPVTDTPDAGACLHNAAPFVEEAGVVG